jgi:hypothetical protein
MRYVIQGTVPADVGNKLDASGGPGKLLGHVMTRFKPDCMYANYESRELFIVVDFETPAKQAEFMLLWSKWFGNYTKMTSVQRIADVQKDVEEAMGHVSKAPQWP